MKLLYILAVVQAISSYTYKSYQNKIECNSKSDIVTPKSLQALQTIVNDAIKSNIRVKVIGARHSITDVICTDGIPINLGSFKNVTVNKVDMTATIGTGIELIDAMNALHQAGVTINHIPAYGGITIGGAIGLGAHGSSLVHANTLSEYLVRLTFIDGQGNLRTIQEGDPDFDAFRVNFGMLGIVVDATIKVVPSFKMNIHNYRVADDLLTKHTGDLINMARNNDWFQFWWFPTNNGLVISEGKFIGTEVKGNAKTNMISGISPFIATASKLLFEVIQSGNNSVVINQIQKSTEKSLYQFNLLKPQIFTDNGLYVNPAVGYAYRLMANKCAQCPWDPTFGDNLSFLPDEYSVGLPLSKLSAVIADMEDLLSKYPTHFPLIGLFFRLSRPARGIMALAHGEETFHIDWTFPMRLDQFKQPPYGLSVMQSLVQLLVFKHGGRPHWGKNGLVFFNHATLSTRYDIPKFKAAVQKYDPNGLFSNKFGNRILGLGEDAYEVPKKVVHCALQDYCICKKDSDCSKRFKCGSLIGYNVCY